MSQERGSSITTTPGRAPRRRRLLWGGVALAIVIALAVGVFVAVQTAQAQLVYAREAPRIRTVCQQAVIAERQAQIPPASYHGGPMRDAIQRQMLANAQQTLGKWYTNPQLTAEMAQAQQAISSERSGAFHVLDAGAGTLTFSQINVSGATASVAAQGIIWLSFTETQSNGSVEKASPHNLMDFTFTLTLVHGQWMISGQITKFASGSGP